MSITDSIIFAGRKTIFETKPRGGGLMFLLQFERVAVHAVTRQMNKTLFAALLAPLSVIWPAKCKVVHNRLA